MGLNFDFNYTLLHGVWCVCFGGGLKAQEEEQSDVSSVNWKVSGLVSVLHSPNVEMSLGKILKVTLSLIPCISV